MAIHDDFVSAAEAARMLNITSVRIGFLCRKGRFKGAEKIGSSWVIPREAVVNHKRLPPGSKPKTPKRNSDELIIKTTLEQATNLNLNEGVSNNA